MVGILYREAELRVMSILDCKHGRKADRTGHGTRDMLYSVQIGYWDAASHIAVRHYYLADRAGLAFGTSRGCPGLFGVENWQLPDLAFLERSHSQESA